jgi:hypothetical protein
MVQRFLPAAFVVTALASGTLVTAVLGDEPTSRGRAASPAPLAAGTAAKASAQPAQQHLYLIRTTLLTLEAANRTGNYSVLRDAAAPVFQQSHSTADLALAFQTARATLDLSAIALKVPTLSQAPTITAEKRLHLSGHIPDDTRPVAFDMVFEPVAGHWRLAALAVGPAAR